MPFRIDVPAMTFERYGVPSVAAAARYVPTVAGFFCAAPLAGGGIFRACFYYEYDGVTGWELQADPAGGAIALGDGANFGYWNETASAQRILIMRAGYSPRTTPPEVGSMEKGMLTLEADDKGYIGVDINALRRTFGETGKTLEQLIEEDTEDKMGYGKYLSILHNAGYCLGRSA